MVEILLGIFIALLLILTFALGFLCGRKSIKTTTPTISKDMEKFMSDWQKWLAYGGKNE